jgi:hypothetical protein
MIKPKRHFAISVNNSDYEASLILRKICEILGDEAAARDDLLRIVDESGEDYLYHKSYFVVVEFPVEVEHAMPRVMPDRFGFYVLCNEQMTTINGQFKLIGLRIEGLREDQEQPDILRGGA